MHSKLLAIVTVLLLAASPTTSFAQAPKSLVPDAENYEDWVDFIRPSKSERSFEEIGWRSEFWPAVEEARRLGRPILLWTMNGHPLGCT